MQPLRALRAAFALALLGGTLVVGIMALPGTSVAADDAPVVAPAIVTATAASSPTSPSYIIGPYNGTNGFFVSIDDPNPYRTAGCPDGNNLCLASGSRDDR